MAPTTTAKDIANVTPPLTLHGLVPQSRCPACGGAPGRTIGAKDGLRVVRCARCTLQFSEMAPAPAALPQLFDETYFHGGPSGYPDYAKDEPIHRARAREYLADLARHVPRPGALLDVGCATGFFLDEARRAGWRAEGLEVSAWAADYARRRLGLDVVTGTFPHPALEGRRYDAITLLNVFEQLTDLPATERALRAMVRPGGIVALESWDCDAPVVRLLRMRWHKYRPRETPHYLNRRALAALFAPPHWRLVTFRARTKWISLGHGLHVLGLRGEDDGGSRLMSLKVPYRVGDLVWAVLQRTA